MTIRKKASYLADYEIVRNERGKKELVYRGDIYQCHVSDGEWKQYRRLILASSFLYVFLWCLASLADPSSLRAAGTIYVIIPYVGLCFPGLIGLFRAFRLQQLSQRMERMDYEQCFVSLNLCTAFLAGLGPLAAVAQLVHMVVHHAFRLGEWLAMLCFLLIGAAAFASYRMQKRYPCKNTGKVSPST